MSSTNIVQSKLPESMLSTAVKPEKQHGVNAEFAAMLVQARQLAEADDEDGTAAQWASLVPIFTSSDQLPDAAAIRRILDGSTSKRHVCWQLEEHGKSLAHTQLIKQAVSESQLPASDNQPVPTVSKDSDARKAQPGEPQGMAPHPSLPLSGESGKEVEPVSTEMRKIKDPQIFSIPVGSAHQAPRPADGSDGLLTAWDLPGQRTTSRAELNSAKGRIPVDPKDSVSPGKLPPLHGHNGHSSVVSEKIPWVPEITDTIPGLLKPQVLPKRGFETVEATPSTLARAERTAEYGDHRFVQSLPQPFPQRNAGNDGLLTVRPNLLAETGIAHFAVNSDHWMTTSAGHQYPESGAQKGDHSDPTLWRSQDAVPMDGGGGKTTPAQMPTLLGAAEQTLEQSKTLELETPLAPTQPWGPETVVDPRPTEVISSQVPDDIPTQIVERMQFVTTAERGEVRIQLQPEYLGDVRIRFVIEHGVVTAEFTAENQSVREIIQANLNQLRSNLEGMGLDIQHLAVNVGNQSAEQNADQHPFPNNEHDNGTERATAGDKEPPAGEPRLVGNDSPGGGTVNLRI